MNNKSPHRDRSFGNGFTREPFGDIKNALNRLTRPLRNVFSRQKDKISSSSPKRVQRQNDNQHDRSPTSPFRRFGSLRFNKKSPIKMDRLRRSFRDSFRRKIQVPGTWPMDEQAVRSSTCSFSVKYLGCIEVYKATGSDVCEEAMDLLKNARRRPVRGFLHINKEGVRVVDKDTKSLILDHSIEKVSFCAASPDHKYDFSYIHRDGTTMRWMCHGYLATKDPADRLSKALDYAFKIFLEQKNRYNNEYQVRMAFDRQNSAFTRIGSFRQRAITDRLHCNERGIDVCRTTPSAVVIPQPKAPVMPPNLQVIPPIPQIPPNPHAIERPHASPLMLERQGSCRALSSLNSQSPFKRRMSLRLNDLPSNLDRQRLFSDTITNSQYHEPLTNSQFGEILQPIQLQPPQIQKADTTYSVTDVTQQPDNDVIDALCKELNHVSKMITRNENRLDGLNDDGTELNFNLQTVLRSTPLTAVPDLVSSINTLPSTSCTDIIPKSVNIIPQVVNVRPIEVVPPSVVINPFTPSHKVSIDESAHHNPVVSLSYATTPCQPINNISKIPSEMLLRVQDSDDKNENCNYSSSTAEVIAIIPPNNTLLQTTEELLDQFVEITTPEPYEANLMTAMNSPIEPLSIDPFDAGWVPSQITNITNITNDTDNFANIDDLPIASNTNPFLSPNEDNYCQHNEFPMTTVL